MLYAKKNIHRVNAGLLIRLIDLLQTEGKEDIRPYLERLFTDIHSIITKEKNYYTLENRQNIQLISFMVKHHEDYFKKKEVKELVNTELDTFKGFLQEATQKL